MTNPMNGSDMVELCKRHTLYPWSRGDAVDPLPVDRAEGVYLYTPDGRRILDFNSQLMCVNIGHSHPKVVAAIAEQAKKLCFVYPGTATQPRAELGQMLAKIVPGNINTFFFTLGGAEANENAIRAARLYTGRHKILSRYRSYHGATMGAINLTGDPRRWPAEPSAIGFVKVMDPQPYNYSFGNTDEERVANYLTYLEEVIQHEGPHTIAAMFVESITGANGVLAPPKGFLSGVHRLLQQHGILLVCDEVMAGFGRTGKMFGFEHDGVVPDIVTMAKGLTSAYVPLGAMGVSDPIAKHFQDHVFWGGLTYGAHPLALATAKAALEVLMDEGLVENAARLEATMLEHMHALQARHRSVRTTRCVGLFGAMELQDQHGELLAPFNGNSKPMQMFQQNCMEAGVFMFTRWWMAMCNPPLCATADHLAEGFAGIDKALTKLEQSWN